MGELSSGLLKSDRSPAVAGDRPSVPPTTVNANSDTRGAEKKFSRNPDLQRDLEHGPENGIARKMRGRCWLSAYNGSVSFGFRHLMPTVTS
jgi:hypothetical protein